MKKLILSLSLTLCANAHAKEPKRNQWGRTPAQERALLDKIIRDHAGEREANEKRLTREYGANGTLSRARRNCADYSHGWIVDDRRDQAHFYYCVPAEKTPNLTCETDPVMAKSPGQYCVENL